MWDRVKFDYPMDGERKDSSALSGDTALDCICNSRFPKSETSLVPSLHCRFFSNMQKKLAVETGYEAK